MPAVVVIVTTPPSAIVVVDTAITVFAAALVVVASTVVVVASAVVVVASAVVVVASAVVVVATTVSVAGFGAGAVIKIAPAEPTEKRSGAAPFVVADIGVMSLVSLTLVGATGMVWKPKLGSGETMAMQSCMQSLYA